MPQPESSPLGAALLGAAVALVVHGATLGTYGPGVPSAWPLVGLALGAALALGRRPPRALLLAGLALAALLPWLPLGGLPAEAMTGAACGLAGAGATIARPGQGFEPAGLAGGAALGLLASHLLEPAQAFLPWLALATISCVGALRFTTPTPAAPTPPRASRATLLCALIAIRLVLTVSAGALVLAFLGPAAYAPAALSTGAGLTLGLAFAPALHRRRLSLLSEPLGLGLVALLLVSAPTQTLELTHAVLALGGLAGGLGLGRPLAQGGAPGLLAGALGLALAPPLLAWAPSRWTPAETAGAALGLGLAPEARAQIGESLERGDTLLRTTLSGPPTLQVVDVLEQRLLARDGRPWSGIPVRRSGDWTHAAADLYRAALPLLLPTEAPRRLAVVSLGTGVSAGALLTAAPEAELTAIEGDPAVLAALRDPGELFGLANHRLLAPDVDWGPRFRLLEAPAWPTLRSDGPWDVVVLGGHDPARGLLELARRRGSLVVAALSPPAGRDDAPLRSGAPPSLRARLVAFRAAFPEVLAFWPGGTAGLVLVGGAAQLQPARAAERWPGIAPAVARARGPLSSWARLLGTCLADADGIERFLTGTHPDTPSGLAAAGADPAPAVALPADPLEASRFLTALAEGAAVRKLPAAAGWAARGAELDRSVHAVRLLGDLRYREGDADAAAQLWREALALDPAAAGPRLSLVSFHLNRGEREQARVLLEEGLAQGEASPALSYALGELAEQEDEHLLAARHFEAAGHFRDAPLRMRRAVDQLRQGDRSLSLAQEIAAAALLLDRSRTATEEAGQLRQESLERALRASNRCDAEEPGIEARATLARVLGQLAADESFALAQRNLYDHQARVLQPVPGAAQRLLRARALIQAERAAEADFLLRELLRADPDDGPTLLVWGEALEALEQRAAAIEAYRRGLAGKAPSSSDAWVYERIARLHLAEGRHVEALAVVEDALELTPEQPRLLHAQGQLLLELGRRGEALVALRAYLALARPDDPNRPPIEARVEALERELER